MTRTDLSQIVNLQNQASSYSAASRSTSAPLPPPPDSSASSVHADVQPARDSVEVGRRPDARPTPSDRDRDAARKMADQLPPADQASFADILKILNESGSNAFKAMRAIIAQRAGLTSDSASAIDPEMLASALQQANGSPDPQQRVGDVVNGVHLAPEDQKNEFLKAAQSVLSMEQSAARRAVANPKPAPGPESTSGQIVVDPQTGQYAPQGGSFSIEVNFDLFFSVSARSSVKSQSDASGSFYEATQAVSASFESNFSLSIAGQFLSLADAAEKLDPKVLDAFSKATQGLAGLDQQALDRFFQASDALFTALEKNYGLSSTALDGVAEEIKATAESFFNAVDATTQGVFPGLSLDQIFSLPSELDSNGSTDLLALLNSLAEQRDPEKTPLSLLESLIAGENARGASQPAPDLDFLKNLFSVDPAIAA